MILMTLKLTGKQSQQNEHRVGRVCNRRGQQYRTELISGASCLPCGDGGGSGLHGCPRAQSCTEGRGPQVRSYTPLTSDHQLNSFLLPSHDPIVYLLLYMNFFFSTTKKTPIWLISSPHLLTLLFYYNLSPFIFSTFANVYGITYCYFFIHSFLFVYLLLLLFSLYFIFIF